MKHLSHWARRHARIAIPLIVAFEIINAFNGILLGVNLLQGWAAISLLLLGLGLLIGGLWIRSQSANNPGQAYAVGRRWLFGAFLGNVLLFGVLGGLWAEQAQVPTPDRAAWGLRRAIIRSDTTVTATHGQSAWERSRTGQKAKPQEQTGKRIGFVLLFVLGLALTYVTVGLACGLACAGYGFFAVITLILSLGFSAGGIFFLNRSFQQVIKPMREMDRSERRRTLRPFWIAWAALISIVGIVLLLAAVS
jgi:hypothetical protein